jgi:hypothetical protein
MEVQKLYNIQYKTLIFNAKRKAQLLWNLTTLLRWDMLASTWAGECLVCRDVPTAAGVLGSDGGHTQ